MTKTTILAAIAAGLLQATLASAQCSDEPTPARPVPKCRNVATGERYDGSGDCPAGFTRLWPRDYDFRPVDPGQVLPENRDSSDFTSTTPPSEKYGHEIFQSLDVVGDRLFVAYNAGLQVWSIAGGNAPRPSRLEFVEGWAPPLGPGDFLEFPPFGESDSFLRDIAALDPGIQGDRDDLVAAAALDGVGVSLWAWDDDADRLDQLYQRPANATFEVEIAEIDGRVYAFAAGFDGVQVFDATSALQYLGSGGCLDQGSGCSGVRRGRLGPDETSRYLSSLVEPGGGSVLVAMSDGGGGVEVWELDNAQTPSGAAQRLLRSAIDAKVRDSALFRHPIDGETYLAIVEYVGPTSRDWALRIYDFEGCRSTLCSSLSRVWSFPLANTYSTQQHFLDYSEADLAGAATPTPFLFVAAGKVGIGRDLEHLIDLTGLAAPQGGGEGDPPILRTVTASGDTYTEGCYGNGGIGYWSDQYEYNEFGIGNVGGRRGQFGGNHFYRVAIGILDVHALGDEPVGDLPTVKTDLVTAGELWFDKPIEFAATSQSCESPSGVFDWRADFPAAGSSHCEACTATEILEFEPCAKPCGGLDGERFDVWAETGCTNGVPTPIKERVTLKDPRPYIEGDIAFVPDQVPEGGAYPECTNFTFAAATSGKDLSHSWTVKDGGGSVVDVGSTGSTPQFGWSPEGVSSLIFGDGFEGGSMDAWSFFCWIDCPSDPYDKSLSNGSRELSGAAAEKLAAAIETYAIELTVESTDPQVSGSDFAEVSVVIDSSLPCGGGDAEVSSFDIQPRSQCGGCVSGYCDCSVDEAIRFEIEATGSPSTFLLDWNGSGPLTTCCLNASACPQCPVIYEGGTTYSVSHTYTQTGYPWPAVVSPQDSAGQSTDLSSSGIRELWIHP